GFHHVIVLEALADQIAVEFLKFPVVRDRVAAAQPLRQRRLEQRLVIDPIENVVDDAPRRGVGDPGALNLHADAQLAAPPQRGLGASDGFRHARVVDRPLLAQPRDRLVYLGGRMPLARETLTDLQLGELAPREHLHAVVVGTHRPFLDPITTASYWRASARRLE